MDCGIQCVQNCVRRTLGFPSLHSCACRAYLPCVCRRIDTHLVGLGLLQGSHAQATGSVDLVHGVLHAGDSICVKRRRAAALAKDSCNTPTGLPCRCTLGGANIAMEEISSWGFAALLERMLSMRGISRLHLPVHPRKCQGLGVWTGFMQKCAGTARRAAWRWERIGTTAAHLDRLRWLNVGHERVDDEEAICRHALRELLLDAACPQAKHTRVLPSTHGCYQAHTRVLPSTQTKVVKGCTRSGRLSCAQHAHNRQRRDMDTSRVNALGRVNTLSRIDTLNRLSTLRGVDTPGGVNTLSRMCTLELRGYPGQGLHPERDRLIEDVSHSEDPLRNFPPHLQPSRVNTLVERHVSSSETHCQEQIKSTVVQVAQRARQATEPPSQHTRSWMRTRGAHHTHAHAHTISTRRTRAGHGARGGAPRCSHTSA